MISASAWGICSKVTSQDMPWLERQMNSKHTKEKLAWFSLYLSEIIDSYLRVLGYSEIHITEKEIFEKPMPHWLYGNISATGRMMLTKKRYDDRSDLQLSPQHEATTTNLYWNRKTSKLCKTDAKPELNANHYFGCLLPRKNEREIGDVKTFCFVKDMVLINTANKEHTRASEQHKKCKAQVETQLSQVKLYEVTVQPYISLTSCFINKDFRLNSRCLHMPFSLVDHESKSIASIEWLIFSKWSY